MTASKPRRRQQIALGEKRSSRGFLPFKNFSTKVSYLIKKRLVYGLFWSRSNAYKKYAHFFVVIFTVITFVTGINASLTEAGTSALNSDIAINPGNIDLLEQGSDIQSVLVTDSTRDFEVTNYVIEKGDTLTSIANKFGITEGAVKDSNLDVLDYWEPFLAEGDTLKIPEINGVIIPVESGDTIDSIMGKIRKGDRLDIIEINNLLSPDYGVGTRTEVFVPDGEVVAPPKPEPVIPTVIYANAPSSYGPIPAAGQAALNGISFINPLSHPSCAGYGWSRGFSSWHNGVDLARGGGCEIRAAAAGTVRFSGWEPQGGGYAVTIDHGNGVHTVYYHNSVLYVRPGQGVSAGQEISRMGCTGLCTGTHLHLGLRVNYVYTDPAIYVPL